MKNLSKTIGKFIMIVMAALILNLPVASFAKDSKNVKSKFYDFSDQLIDGDVKKPTTLYTEIRQKAKFSKLVHLQRHFMNELMKTAKRPVFK